MVGRICWIGFSGWIGWIGWIDWLGWIGWITGSDLCFSIRSVLLVDEPGGDKLGEGGVRGGRGGSGFFPDRSQNGQGGFQDSFVFQMKTISFFLNSDHRVSPDFTKSI